MGYGPSGPCCEELWAFLEDSYCMVRLTGPHLLVYPAMSRQFLPLQSIQHLEAANNLMLSFPPKRRLEQSKRKENRNKRGRNQAWKMLQGGTEGQGAVFGPSLYTQLHYTVPAKCAAKVV